MSGPTKLYHVVLNGHRTTMRLNDADAEALGGTPVEDTAGRHAAPAADAAPRKARTPANKARGGDVANKAAQGQD